MKKYSFEDRHIGVGQHHLDEMLEEMGINSLEELIDRTIPPNIRSSKELEVGEAMSEEAYLEHIKAVGAKNSLYDTYIGLGYYNCYTPAVIRRNILENPGWYTAYTPYQSEIAQGRLEGLLNFQTMVMDLTNMEIANASLLDEGTAAAEAMVMLHNTRSRQKAKNGAKRFFVSENCFPQVIDVLKTRSLPMGIELVIGDHNTMEFDGSYFGALVQYPNVYGEVNNFNPFIAKAQAHEVKVAVGADLLSLALLTPPGDWGADVVYGSTQRFGVPMGYGGPHAAFFATRESYKRNIPGRIIGVSVDRSGEPALRMALQTREQHIRRAKATSNICTAQALLAVIAGMYAVYHGPKGIKAIAEDVHAQTKRVAQALKELDYQLVNDTFFDSLTFKLPEHIQMETLRIIAEGSGINLRYQDDGVVGISLDETKDVEKVDKLIQVLADVVSKTFPEVDGAVKDQIIPAELLRTSEILDHPVFNSYHSETEMMRYLKKLENKDLSLTHSMIPLGSCTMKLNAAAELEPITWPEFANVHPFAPVEQAEGYHEVFRALDKDLSDITGFDKFSLQPNSGAQGEYAGLMVIRKYHQSRNESHRNVVLIPSSAHGTNPASGVMAGMKVVVVKCDERGNIDVEDLREKAEKHSEELAALMVTYPSTHGVFESAIVEINEIIHQHGGQVYMDGANMNAQVGLTSPGLIGADVCHLNLHKTFAIPHGGGGPGMGPIGVKKHLAPFLPSNPVIPTGGEDPIRAISSTPFGSALILLISYGYIKMLGSKGLKKTTQLAIANANYIRAKLNNHYNVLYTGEQDTVGHEMIIDCRMFKKSAGIEVEDIAKRLIDYGFHAPTVSFPVPGTMMIEPTESESKSELDRFTEAMKSIRAEIARIEDGIWDKQNNPLKNAPHTALEVIEDWDRPYSRAEAVYPLDYLKGSKYWSPVARVNNAHGDRNLICSCPPMESYEQEDHAAQF